MKILLIVIVLLSCASVSFWFIHAQKMEGWKTRLQMVDTELAKTSRSENYDQWHALTKQKILILGENDSHAAASLGLQLAAEEAWQQKRYDILHPAKSK